MNERNDPDGVGYDPITNTVHLPFEWDNNGAVCVAILTGVAVATDRRPEEFESLFSVINTNALESLFAPTSSETPRNTGSVTFTYGGFDITVYAAGEVEIDVSDIDFDTVQSRS